MGTFIAAYLVHAARIAFAAGSMFIVAIVLWLAVGILTSLLGIQTGTVVMISLVLTASIAVAAGSYISVRYITPNAILHPVVAAVGLAILFVVLTTQGDVGYYRVVVPMCAGVVASIAAVGSRMSR